MLLAAKKIEEKNKRNSTISQVSTHPFYSKWRWKKIEVVRDLHNKLQFIVISLYLWSLIGCIGYVCLILVI